MLSNINIEKIEPIIKPEDIIKSLPPDDIMIDQIINYRQEISNIIQGNDKRLLAIVGPCSIHDYNMAIEYAHFLKKLSNHYKDTIMIVMRVYFEKPRTILGWKGLINDPMLDETYLINDGLFLARRILLEINRIGLPVGCEFLDVITPQYLSDLVSWGAIGARTTESQIHRQLASGLSMPIGFKNGTTGNIKIAAQAISAAKSKHVFLGVTSNGSAAKVTTTGNKDCHIILRGGNSSPNYEKYFLDQTINILSEYNQKPFLMVDCSHDNSLKIHTNQILVANYLADQIRNGNNNIIGVMIESNLKEGKQKLVNKEYLEYGVSITDACINLKTTEDILLNLSFAIKERLKKNNNLMII